MNSFLVFIFSVKIYFFKYIKTIKEQINKQNLKYKYKKNVSILIVCVFFLMCHFFILLISNNNSPNNLFLDKN